MRTVDRFNQRSQKIYNGQDVLKNHFLKRYPILYTDDPENYDQIQKYSDQHEFVWIVDSSIETLRSFPWHFRPTKDADAVHQFPYVYKKSKRPKSWTTVQLVPTNYKGNKTVTHPHICGIYDAYKGRDRFDIFFIGKPNKTYDRLLKKYKDIKIVKSHEEARLESKTDMFWLIPDDVIVKDTFNFDYDPDEWSFEYTHVFGNRCLSIQNGIALFPKNYIPTEKELKYRFYANKKEIKIIASYPAPYDVVFISYQEPNADENYKKLLKKCPTAKRIHGVKGIHQAHIAAAELCNTRMFWAVDGDAVVLNNFDFDYQVAPWDQDTVHVWRSQNPINDLVYGYGGVKLLPRQLTIDMDTSKPDMTTSISSKFKAVQAVSNITEFNTDPFNTWKSAFRECAKLSSRIIDRQNDYETNHRLMTWTSVGENRPFGKYAIAGAKAGRNFGLSAKQDINLINDFGWLELQFNSELLGE